MPAVPAVLVQGRSAVPGVEAEDAHSTCPPISVDGVAALAASLVVFFRLPPTPVHKLSSTTTSKKVSPPSWPLLLLPCQEESPRINPPSLGQLKIRHCSLR